MGLQNFNGHVVAPREFPFRYCFDWTWAFSWTGVLNVTLLVQCLPRASGLLASGNHLWCGSLEQRSCHLHFCANVPDIIDLFMVLCQISEIEAPKLVEEQSFATPIQFNQTLKTKAYQYHPSHNSIWQYVSSSGVQYLGSLLHIATEILSLRIQWCTRL